MSPQDSPFIFGYLQDGPVPSPRVRGGDVLYLDFDGVLHHEHVCHHPKRGIYFGGEAVLSGRVNQLFEHCGLLEELLSPYPQVRIVLSTTWAQRGYLWAREWLTPELARRCVGSTFHRHMDRFLFSQSPRGMQVWSDVQRRRPRSWVAIDDDILDWPSWCRDRLVHSCPVLGISHPDVLADLREKFRAHFLPAEPPLDQPS